MTNNDTNLPNDASSNEVNLKSSTAQSQPSTQDPTAVKPNRLIYDMQFTSREDQLPGCIARSEGDPPCNIKGTPTIDQCYGNFGTAFDFFHQVFGRNSIDGQGCPLIGIVNFGFFYPNATWSINRANMQHVLVFGNGWDNDPWNQGAATNTWAGMFGGFVGSLEVVVHEMMHGVTRSHVQLLPTDEPGALDEHLADVFGVMAEQWSKKQSVDEADWLIGEDCVIPEKKGVALRSFISPGTAYDFSSNSNTTLNNNSNNNNGDGSPVDEKLDDFRFRGFLKDPQRAHWKNKFLLSEDRGGVHINSGIPNKAFHLAATKLGGRSWETAGQVWYAALTSDQVPKNCTFRRWAMHTVDAARRDARFGDGVADVILDAWQQVGLVPRW